MNSVRRRLAVLCQASGNLRYNCRAHYHTIGNCANGLGMIGCLDAETDTNRQVGVRLDTPDRA
ncbi:hypothetical protein D3C80_2095820 [compost metagenome]